MEKTLNVRESVVLRCKIYITILHQYYIIIHSEALIVITFKNILVKFLGEQKNIFL